MSEDYVYIFVRQDLSLAQQIVQSNHASLGLARYYPQQFWSDDPNVVLIGVPNKLCLYSVIDLLGKAGVKHTQWFEPDNNSGLTAIATYPVWGATRELFKEFEIWKPENQLSQ